MRELIERFSYRFELGREQERADRWGAFPGAPRNPLQFVAVVAIMSVILDATEPFFFHRDSTFSPLSAFPPRSCFSFFISRSPDGHGICV